MADAKVIVSAVSIHAPAWGATPVSGRTRLELTSFQSTRPRGARRWDELALKNRAKVSIHAPAWGATKVIHASSPNCSGFNPRARVGRDCRRRIPTRS